MRNAKFPNPFFRDMKKGKEGRNRMVEERFRFRRSKMKERKGFRALDNITLCFTHTTGREDREKEQRQTYSKRQ